MILEPVRTVPTFVSAHTYCASRKSLLRCQACSRLTNDAINYAIKYTTKMKPKFSYGDQIKFNEPELTVHREHQNGSILLTTNC